MGSNGSVILAGQRRQGWLEAGFQGPRGAIGLGGGRATGIGWGTNRG